MTQPISIRAFAEHLLKVGAVIKLAERPALRAAGKIVRDEARSEIGHYQPARGPFGAWAPLADSTLAEKMNLGYAPPDNPLLRTGDLRASIGYTVTWSPAGASVHIGSDAVQARILEMGDNHIPPRSYLGGALVKERDQAVGAAMTILWAAWRTTRPASSK